jgi:hypothetical protein
LGFGPTAARTANRIAGEIKAGIVEGRSRLQEAVKIVRFAPEPASEDLEHFRF